MSWRRRLEKRHDEFIHYASKRNRRSLHYATPDFLLSLVALAIFMRLSLTKAAHVAMSSAAWQEIRVRSGRDDNFSCTNKFVISTGA